MIVMIRKAIAVMKSPSEAIVILPINGKVTSGVLASVVNPVFTVTAADAVISCARVRMSSGLSWITRVRVIGIMKVIARVKNVIANCLKFLIGR